MTADGHELSSRGGRVTRVRDRPVSRFIAAAFLLGVAILGCYALWSLASGSQEVEPEVLAADLDAFDAPADSRALPVEVTPCTGEGSFPAYASRRFVVHAMDEDAVASALRAQAEELGWRDIGGLMVREDRSLSIGSWDSSDEGAGVEVRVDTDSAC